MGIMFPLKCEVIWVQNDIEKKKLKKRESYLIKIFPMCAHGSSTLEFKHVDSKLHLILFYSKAVLLQEWPQNQQHQYHLGPY